MRYKTILLSVLLGGVLWITACAPRPKIVPEITDHLSHVPVYTQKGESPILRLFSAGPGLMFVDSRGDIRKVDTETEQKEDTEKVESQPVYQAGLENPPDIFISDSHLVLTDNEHKQLHIFSLADLQDVKTLSGLDFEELLGVDERLLILGGKDRILIFDYYKEQPIYTIPLENQKIFNCEFGINRIVIGTDHGGIVYYRDKNSSYTFNVEGSITSGILLDGDVLYFGSGDRELVKYSIESHSVIWRYPLPKKLVLKPQRVAEWIMVTPEDFNIYFFSPNGTLYWWDRFDSTRLMPAIHMKDHVAVVLFPRDEPFIKFFDYKKKKSYSHQLKGIVKDTPIFKDQHLFLLVRNPAKEEDSIMTVGNRFDIDIKVKDKSMKTVGKSIKFDFTPINLFKAGYKVTIQDKDENEVFSREIDPSDVQSLVWIPKSPGDYVVKVDGQAENRKNIKNEYSLNVIDLDSIVAKYYQQVHRQCRAEVFETAGDKKIDEEAR